MSILGFSPYLCHIQNPVKTNRVIKRLGCTMFVFGIQIRQIMYTNTEAVLLILNFDLDLSPGRCNTILCRGMFLVKLKKKKNCCKVFVLE